MPGVNQAANAYYLPAAVHAQNSTWTTALKLTVPTNANGIMVQALTQNIRMLIPIPGGAEVATAVAGWQLRAGDPERFVPCQPGQTVTFMQETATAVLEYQFMIQVGSH